MSRQHAAVRKSELDKSSKPKRRNEKMPATGTARKKIIVDFPTSLLQRTEQAAEQLSTDRSKVIRTAVEQFLGGLEKGEFEKELIAGYRANSKADRRIAAEFVNVDTEGI